VLYKTFKTGKEFYVYDTSSNNIFLISENIYKYLNNKLSIDNLTGEEREMITSFRESGLLKTEAYKKINFPFIDDFDNFFGLTKNNIKKLTIVINGRCNFQCRYCLYCDSYKKRKNLDDFEIEMRTAYKGIDFYFKNSTNIKKKNITFYGGEPLINKTKLFKIIEYARNFYGPQNLKINLTTNGFLIDQKIIDFFVRNEIYTNISLDGPKQIHNKYRKTKSGKNTHDLIIKKFKFIKKNYPKYYSNYLSVSVTITPPYNFNLIEKYFTKNKLFAPLGIDLSYVEEKDANWLSSKFSKNDLYGQKIKKEIKKIKECTKKHLKGERINDLYKNIFYTRLKKILQRNKAQLKNDLKIEGPCFPGLNMLLMDSRGDFYICTMLDDSYSIGNINEGFSKDRIKKALKDIYDFVDLNCKIAG